MYYTYKPEIQLITCVTRHINDWIHNLFQQQGDQGNKAPASTDSHLANKSHDSSHMKNLPVRILKTTYNGVQYSLINNFKQYGKNTIGRNIQLLEEIIYQVVRECLVAVVHLVPGVGSLLYGVYNFWNWSVKVTEFVNRNQMALCIRKFIQKKFWDWIETDEYERNNNK